MKNKSTALVLCILFGWLGVHKFYLDRPGIGVIYFFTGGLFLIGWVIDIIMLATMSSDTFNTKYNTIQTLLNRQQNITVNVTSNTSKND